MIIYIIAALLIASTAFLFIQSYKKRLQKIKWELEEVENELRASKSEIKQNYEMAAEIESDAERLKREVLSLQIKKDTLSQQHKDISDTIEEKQNYLRCDLAAIEELQATQRAQLKDNLSQLEKSEREKLALTLEKVKAECSDKLDRILQSTELEIQECEKQAAAARDKYFSVVEVLGKVEETECDTNSQINVPNIDRLDIEYLLNNVVEKLRNPDVLYKLIWSEYIQKPTNQMLDYILPQKDCSGIYKITNIKTGKCYIGRSTSVRKRLTDHIKSTIGISTIANQYVHQVMRKEGVWNFRFELIEECEKSDLGSREKYYIEFFNSSNQKYGYNAVGGSEYKE